LFIDKLSAQMHDEVCLCIDSYYRLNLFVSCVNLSKRNYREINQLFYAYSLIIRSYNFISFGLFDHNVEFILERESNFITIKIKKENSNICIRPYHNLDRWWYSEWIRICTKREKIRGRHDMTGPRKWVFS
jgi:hypothetical protein